jgi:hypothetical protein
MQNIYRSIEFLIIYSHVIFIAFYSSTEGRASIGYSKLNSFLLSIFY